jgi:hypothetical protein
MAATRESVLQFINFCREHTQGRESGDVQPFLGEFFKAFGYDGALQAGAKFELPIPSNQTTIVSHHSKNDHLNLNIKQRSPNTIYNYN